MPNPVRHCVPRGAVAETGEGAILPNSKGRDEAPEEAVLCPAQQGRSLSGRRPLSCPDAPGAKLEALGASADQMA